MTGHQPWKSFLMVLPIIAPLVGCSQPSEDVESQGPVSSLPVAEETSAGNGLSDALSSWESGNTDEAVAQFVAIDWSQPGALDDMRVLRLSEEEFVALSRSQKNEFQTESLEMWPSLKQLVSQVITTAKGAKAAGDKATATAQLDAVGELAIVLSSPDRSKVVQLYGQSVTNMLQQAENGTEEGNDSPER